MKICISYMKMKKKRVNAVIANVCDNHYYILNKTI